MTTTKTSRSTEELLEQLVDAIGRLSNRPDRPPTEAERIRQRVAFGYQVLGTLSGRVSSASGNEFDVRVVAATRQQNGDITLDGLPPAADFVELRTGDKAEVLKIDRDGDGGVDATAEGSRRPDTGSVQPKAFAKTETIGSLVVLGNRRGPLIAFGPRLGPVSNA